MTKKCERLWKLPIWMSASFSVLMKSMDVNWLPWSVFMISGLPWRRIASFRASVHGPVSRVVESRQAKTLRLNQSSTATRLTNPRAIGM